MSFLGVSWLFIAAQFPGYKSSLLWGGGGEGERMGEEEEGRVGSVDLEPVLRAPSRIQGSLKAARSLLEKGGI